MSDLIKRYPSTTNSWGSPFNAVLRSPSELMDSLERLFENTPGPASIRVEEFMDGNTLVIRAELPGINPDQDVEVTFDDGLLRIHAERRESEETKDNGSFRSEFRYGSFSRNIPLPEGTKETDITASYTDGVLEVRTPVPEKTPAPQTPKKLPIARTHK